MRRAKPRVSLDSYVIDVLLPDLVGHDKRPAAFIVYLWLWGATRSVDRGTAFFSYQTLTDRTGLSKSAVQGAIRLLTRRKLLVSKRAHETAVPEHTVLRPWRR